MVWSHAGVTSWYKNKRGRVIMNSPWRLADYRNMTAEFSADEYVLTPGGSSLAGDTGQPEQASVA
jgi:4-hydroxyacetophenone monooxygenase